MIDLDLKALLSALAALKFSPLVLFWGVNKMRPLRNIDFDWSFDSNLTNEIHVHFADLSVHCYRVSGVSGKAVKVAVQQALFKAGPVKIVEVIMPLAYNELSTLEIAVALSTAINP